MTHSLQSWIKRTSPRAKMCDDVIPNTRATMLASTFVTPAICRPVPATRRGCFRCSRSVVRMSADPSLIRTSEGDDGVQFGTEERSVLKMGRSARDAPRIFPKGIDPSLYTLEQLAFLSRKEQGIMPTSNDCSCCDGVGTVICHTCRGHGNNQSSQEAKFSGEVRLNSDAIPGEVLGMMMKEGMMCWVCRGAKHIACTSCEGSGKRDFADNWITD